MIRNMGVLLLVGLLTASVSSGVVAEPLLGFDGTNAEEQRARESRFDAALDPADLREWMKHLSARPHHVGSEWGEQNARYLADLFSQWGYETRIETFDVLLPTPTLRSLKMIEPVPSTALLDEPAIAEDTTSSQKDEQLPTYNAFSIDGDVTGELVYVNYGVPEDYEELERRGIDVTGKVVIPLKYRSSRGFSEGLAAVRLSVEEAKAAGLPWSEIGWTPWGYIDHSGKFVSPQRFSVAEPFKDGVAYVWQSSVTLEGFRGFINRAGVHVLDRRGPSEKVPAVPSKLPVPLGF